MSDFQPVIHTYTTPKYLIVNVYLVETPNGVVVIDGATALSTSREIRALADEQIKKPILAVLLTHGHPDHYVGVAEIVRGLDVPFVSTQAALDFAHYQDEHKFASLITNNYGSDAPAQRIFPNRIVRDGEMLTYDGVSFQVRDFGACESGGDTVYSVSVDGVRHAFIGDLIYNHTQSYLRDGHALNWLQALDLLRREFGPAAVLHPGHGDACGTEMTYWQQAYIRAFLGELHALLNGREALEAAEKDALLAKMKNFVPGDKNLNLLKYEMDETIRILANLNEAENVSIRRAA